MRWLALLLIGCGGTASSEGNEPEPVCVAPVGQPMLEAANSSCGISFRAALPALITEETPAGCTEWTPPAWSEDGCSLELHRVCQVETTEPGEATVVARLSEGGEVMVAVEWSSGGACVGVYAVTWD